MSLSALLMRCLLCVTLVLNSAGAAAASVRLLDTAHDAGMAAGIDGDAHATDCASHPVEAGAAGSTPGHDDLSPDPDCCKSASCTCACVHGCATAVSLPASTPVLIVHADILPATFRGHPAPDLPHLIRPPIG